MTNYLRYETDPCTIYVRPGFFWGDGEIEDYAVNFVAPVPETFPTDGNILFNNEEYNGTSKDYKGTLTDLIYLLLNIRLLKQVVQKWDIGLPVLYHLTKLSTEH